MSYKRLKPIREQNEDDDQPDQKDHETNYVQKILWKFEDTALLATSPNLKTQRSKSLPNSPNMKDGQFFNEILKAEGSDNLLLLEELER